MCEKDTCHVWVGHLPCVRTPAVREEDTCCAWEGQMPFVRSASKPKGARKRKEASRPVDELVWQLGAVCFI